MTIFQLKSQKEPETKSLEVMRDSLSYALGLTGGFGVMLLALQAVFGYRPMLTERMDKPSLPVLQTPAIPASPPPQAVPALASTIPLIVPTPQPQKADSRILALRLPSASSPKRPSTTTVRPSIQSERIHLLVARRSNSETTSKTSLRQIASESEDLQKRVNDIKTPKRQRHAAILVARPTSGFAPREDDDDDD